MASDQSKFSLSQKRVGIYFADGDSIIWVQAKDGANDPDTKLVKAIRASYKTFNRAYFGAKKKEPKCPA